MLRVVRPWSHYQNAIFADVANGKGHTHVDALAGSGKTSTIVESLYHVKPGTTALFCAYNKAIQEKLQADAPSTAHVKTLHSLGRTLCMKNFPQITLHAEKTLSLIREKNSSSPAMQKMDHTNLKRAIALCKCYLIDPSADITVSYNLIDEILMRHDVSTAPPNDPFSTNPDNIAATGESRHYEHGF